MKKEIKVMAFGCFDLLHEGHLFYLKKAKSLGKKLIVVIARDKTITKLKKRKPLYNEISRKKLVEALKFVDKAVLGSDFFKSKMNVIKKFKPNIIALGYDKKNFALKLKKELKKEKINAKVIVLPSFNKKKFNSTKLRKKLFFNN